MDHLTKVKSVNTVYKQVKSLVDKIYLAKHLLKAINLFVKYPL